MKDKVKEPAPEKEVNMAVKVPESVHRLLKFYGSRISIQRNTTYNIDEVYAEALKEFTSGISII